jgi:hypothetical protein
MTRLVCADCNFSTVSRLAAFLHALFSILTLHKIVEEKRIGADRRTVGEEVRP